MGGLGWEEFNKFHLVYNGIDTERYDQLLLQKAVIKDKDFFTIGYAGRLARDKGIDILLEAVAVLAPKYNHIRLFIAGNDEKGYKEYLKALIMNKNLQDKVRFIGHLDNMANYYRSLDLFAVCCKRSFWTDYLWGYVLWGARNNNGQWCAKRNN